MRIPLLILFINILFKTLGDLEGFTDFDFTYYPYSSKDLLNTFTPLLNRIKTIVDNFYQIGEFFYFRQPIPQDPYILEMNFDQLKNQLVYLDISLETDNQGSLGGKDFLIDWINNSIISLEKDLDSNRIAKTRGMERQLLSFKVEEKKNKSSIFLRYTLDLINIEGVNKICIFNPVLLTANIMLIKKPVI